MFGPEFLIAEFWYKYFEPPPDAWVKVIQVVPLSALDTTTIAQLIDAENSVRLHAVSKIPLDSDLVKVYGVIDRLLHFTAALVPGSGGAGLATSKRLPAAPGFAPHGSICAVLLRETDAPSKIDVVVVACALTDPLQRPSPRPREVVIGAPPPIKWISAPD